MTAGVYVAIGGPLNGHRVTEQYAGSEYHRFNSADKVAKGKKRCPGCRKNMLRTKAPRGYWVHTTGTDSSKQLVTTFACANQNPGKPSGVLVHESVWEEK